VSPWWTIFALRAALEATGAATGEGPAASAVVTTAGAVASPGVTPRRSMLTAAAASRHPAVTRRAPTATMYAAAARERGIFCKESSNIEGPP
jgi:hypothetical protein